mgnify:CR=1 FL=1
MLNALKVLLESDVKAVIGVFDTRVIGVFVMKNLFALNSFKYSKFKRTCLFSLIK